MYKIILKNNEGKRRAFISNTSGIDRALRSLRHRKQLSELEWSYDTYEYFTDQEVPV